MRWKNIHESNDLWETKHFDITSNLYVGLDMKDAAAMLLSITTGKCLYIDHNN